jgi:DNA-binding NtrC family response regulator
MGYVLVVDDETPICNLLSRWLQAWGYETKQAKSAAEALEHMMADPASIMLCDIRMPGHDGMWLLERVRDRWPQTAVIMATGVDDIQIVARSQRAGVVDYVTKPFGRELLLQALHRAEAKIQQQTPTPPPSASS